MFEFGFCNLSYFIASYFFIMNYSNIINIQKHVHFFVCFVVYFVEVFWYHHHNWCEKNRWKFISLGNSIWFRYTISYALSIFEVELNIFNKFIIYSMGSKCIYKYFPFYTIESIFYIYFSDSPSIFNRLSY